jgi:uncharacterized damage-inducible protein DinB
VTPQAEFLRYSVAKLRQQCGQLEECIAKLTPEQVWQRGGESQNAVGNLLLHLTGNIRQWILTGVAGEPLHRNRDAEFSARGGEPPAVLMRHLSETVHKACDVIERLPPYRLMETLRIQEHEVSVLESIYHVVEHFSGHTGQIILLTKAFTGSDLGFYGYLQQPGGAAGRKP